MHNVLSSYRENYQVPMDTTAAYKIRLNHDIPVYIRTGDTIKSMHINRVISGYYKVYNIQAVSPPFIYQNRMINKSRLLLQR